MMCFCENTFVAIVGMVWLLAADYESVVAAIIYGKMLSETFLRNPLVNIKNRILNPYVNETG